MDHREDHMTFSVRRLAQMFGRSEQTVRRWKDQGKLAAGLEGEESSPGGALVFTLEAVRDFVRRNPSVMDRAEPGCREVLFGEKKPSHAPIPLPGRVSPPGREEWTGGDGFDEAEDKGEGRDSQEDRDDGEGQDGPFYSRSWERDPYLDQLLFRRDDEIREEREDVRTELDRVLEEERALRDSDGSDYLLHLLGERRHFLRSREMELLREHGQLMRERHFSHEPGPYVRQLLLDREEAVREELDRLAEELDTIGEKKAELGL